MERKREKRIEKEKERNEPNSIFSRERNKKKEKHE